MPIDGIKQPNIINIDETLRLRAYDGNFEVAVPWYQDPVVYYFSESITDPAKMPDADYVKGMFEYMEKRCESYFIEVKENGKFIPVGDIHLKEPHPPIVIGVTKYRGVGIGKKVMRAMIARAKEIGIKKFSTDDVGILEDNIVSRKMVEALGFTLVGKIESGLVYELIF